MRGLSTRVGLSSAAQGYSAPIITTASLDAGTENSAYSKQLVGTGTITLWQKVSGTFPTGITISASGLISGTPTQNGTFSNIVIRASGPGGQYDKTYSLVIAAAVADDTVGRTADFDADPDSHLSLSTNDINVFKDQGGSGFDLTNTAEGTKWTRSTSTTLDGIHTALTGGNYNRYMSDTLVLGTSFFSVSAGTLMFIARCDSVAAARSLASINIIDTLELSSLDATGTKIRARINDGSNKTVDVASDTTNFHFIIMTWNGSTLDLYVDGATASVACGNVSSLLGRFAICGNGGTAERWRDALVKGRTYNAYKTSTQAAALRTYWKTQFASLP